MQKKEKKQTTLNNPTYCTLRNIMNICNKTSAENSGKKGVCSHESACIYTAYKIWHLKERTYIHQLLAILKTLQHVSSFKVCNAYKKATVILLLSYFSKGPWQASHKIFSFDAFRSTQFNLKCSQSSAHILNRVILKAMCGFYAFLYPSQIPFSSVIVLDCITNTS